jgi:prepilin-type N-terminal cleavage/methylation domain-containing protein
MTVGPGLTGARAELDASSGITLIEMLAVILILGILAAVVVFSLAGFNDRGREAAKQADRRSLEKAELAFSAATQGDSARPWFGFEHQLAPRFIGGPSVHHDICVSRSKRRFVVVSSDAACPGPPGWMTKS